MTLTEYYDIICEKLGVDSSELMDKLRTTYLDAICEKLGIDVGALPDKIRTTYLDAICKNMGVDVNDLQDRLVVTYLGAILEKKGVDVDAMPDRLLNTYLDAIVAVLGGGSGGESGGNTGGGSGSGGTLPDKNTWEGVFARMDAGTYATDYAIGDCVPLDLGSEGVINMQIAAFDADDLADGTGKAKISWVSKELVGEHRINPYLSGTTEGTGTIGGWGSCELRTYLKDTIKPLIADTVASRIATVTKTQRAYNTDVSRVTQTTEDDVWIPDYNEVFSSGIYTGLFVDNASRIKLARSGSAYYWWTRFAHTKENAICVGKDGAWQSAYTYEPYGIALGFCTN